MPCTNGVDGSVPRIGSKDLDLFDASSQNKTDGEPPWPSPVAKTYSGHPSEMMLKSDSCELNHRMMLQKCEERKIPLSVLSY